MTIRLSLESRLALWLSMGTPGIGYVLGLTGCCLRLVAAGFAAAWTEACPRASPWLCSGLSWAAPAANGAGLTAILASIASRTA
jgi:hypothetical protein